MLGTAVDAAHSSADEWTVSDIVVKVGLIERSQAVKALTTWVELGVLKEDSPDHYRLLKTAQEATATTKAAAKQPAAAVEELPPVVTVQQQQAEQMRVFWKVRTCILIESLSATQSTRLICMTLL